MLFKKIITVYTLIIIQNPHIQNADLLTAEGTGTNSYHSALKGYTVQRNKQMIRNIQLLSNNQFTHIPNDPTDKYQ
jgi:hypothetical protein